MKKLTLLLSAMLLACATNLWAGTITLDNLGAGLTTTSNTEVKTTSITATETGLGTFTLNYLQGKKQGNVILLASSKGAFISNKTPIPGAIKSVTVFINTGASGKTTYHCAFGTSEFTKADATGSTAVNIKGGSSYTYTCSVANAKFFCISLGNANNGQVLKVVVTYDAPSLQSIALSGNPTKKTYMADESLNTDGLVVTGTYSDNSTKTITEGITWEIDPDPLTAGTTSVDVMASVKNAAGKDVTSDVYTVTGLTVTAAKSLTSIAVSGTPAEFWKGDTFNHNGMTVTAKWDDNSTTDVTTEATFSTPDMTTAGTKTITVTYKEKTTTYDITVKTIANTQETAYTVAEAIALIDAGKDLTTEVFVKGIVSEIVTPWSDQYSNITYNISDDGTTNSAQFQLFRCETNGAYVGDKVTAKGKMKKHNETTYEFDAKNTIVAIVPKTVTSIAISGEATTTNYYAGQTFDPAGLVVKATFDDESTADVTELVDWTFDPAVLEEGTTTVSVSATYKELNAAPMVVTVTVGPAPKVVTIDLAKDETTTATADKLEWEGAILTITAAKGKATTNTNNYYPGTSGQSYTSTRFYSGSTLTFTPAKGITLESITYTATTANYTSAMANSTWTNASTSTSGQTVTITPTDGTKAITATIGGTTGGTSFVINYSGEASPTALDNAIVETPAVKTIENGQLVIIRDGVKYNAMGVRLQ